jgi:hypothetical protein
MRANMESADLRDVILRRANLSGANSSGANPKRANLSGANLRGANLKRALLRGTNLYRANLNGADLKDASFCETTMPSGKINSEHCWKWSRGASPKAMVGPAVTVEPSYETPNGMAQGMVRTGTKFRPAVNAPD